MSRAIPLLRPFALAAALLLVLVGTWIGSRQLVKHVAVLPGIMGCRTVDAPAKRTTCVSGRMTHVIQADGYDRAFRELESIAAKNSAISNVCHQAMHQAARKLVSDAARDFTVANEVTGQCVSGFRHSVVEQTVATGTADAVRDILTICATTATGANSDGDTLLGRECYHGAGHGLRRREGSTTRALVACRTTLDDPRAQLKCMGGVMMEAEFSHRAKTVEEGRALCDDLAPDALSACYAARLPTEADRDHELLGRWCDGAPTSAARNLCAKAWGRASDPTIARSICPTLRIRRLYAPCIDGFLRGNLANSHDISPVEGASICLTSPAWSRAACAWAYGAALHVRYADRARAEATCADRLSDGLRAKCLAGVQAAILDTMDPRVV